MTDQDVLWVVEQHLQRLLSPIEQKVVLKTLQGTAYDGMEQELGYVSGYLKEVGAQLWKELSEALGQRVTKRNLPYVLKQYSNRSFVPSSSSVLTLQPLTPTDMSFPGGPLSADSPFYLPRPPIEAQAMQEITRTGCLLRISGPHRFGRSSLLNQITARADTLGYERVYLNLHDAEVSILTSLRPFLRWFCSSLCRQLNLSPVLDHYWDDAIGSKLSCKLFFEHYLLERIDSPIVLILDELQQMFAYPAIAQDMLSLLGSLYEQTRQSIRWQKLRLILSYSTDSLMPWVAPFLLQMGLSLRLPPFQTTEVLQLARLYGLNWRTDGDGWQMAASLQHLVGGHPYLTTVALYHFAQQQLTLEQLWQTAATPRSIYHEHLQQQWLHLTSDAALAAAFQQVLQAEPGVRLDSLSAYRLENMGLAEFDGIQTRITTQLYRLYFQSRGLETSSIQEVSLASAED
ncbi:MAG: AAA-like domain-containing protein [Synechococcales cyanobacterium C42_A2020_086]|jgi:hypothetical protein|nr:AAA-like domain-containing protein [Synechococcales cyanobacterium C42_A2020_086]